MRAAGPLTLSGRTLSAAIGDLLATLPADGYLAVQAYLDRPPPGPAQMFAHLHAELPAAYHAQRDDALARYSGHGSDHPA